MEKKRNILILVKPFARTMPKHQHKYDALRALEKVANVRYWHQDGDIRDILKRIGMKPDFIFHYDIAWNYAFSPKITNLAKVKIPKGCFVLDIHWKPEARRAYFHRYAKPDLIFSASKHPFLSVFPECKSRFRWWPFGINPQVIKDYGLKKTVDYSLLGLIDPRYRFRRQVLKQMSGVKGFAHFKHPGHRTRPRPGLLINAKYAQTINRSRISFTCGSDLNIPVAKFFEIPGCGTLLLAEPNRDITALGFKDKVNYVACTRTNIRAKAQYYLKNRRERLRIARNGYRFIQKKHTVRVRARQFMTAIDTLVKK